eukprot:638823-Prymnesium_polylepis.1
MAIDNWKRHRRARHSVRLPVRCGWLVQSQRQLEQPGHLHCRLGVPYVRLGAAHLQLELEQLELCHSEVASRPRGRPLR